MVSQAVLSQDELNVIIESGDGLEGCELCLEQKPDFVILDVMLPNLNGTEMLRRFTKKIPDTRGLIFYGYQTPRLVRELIQAGAHGFVKKAAPLSELRKGIEIVSSGGSYFGPDVAQL
ncbi:MAG: response regulator transcription factor [Lentimonas sp.]